jgi:hypothetical protein
MVTTCADLVVVGFGVRYVMNVVTTVGPTVTTVVEVRVLTDGWPPASVSMATHCSYQMLRVRNGRVVSHSASSCTFKGV